MWFWKIMIRFFIAIDKNLFNFISTLYDLLIAISRSSVLSQGDIAQFATRVEILLGIFMLFKVSFSLITYIVNPDDFTDKQKGFGKLVQNSVISLTLLVLVPYIFQMAFSLQAKVLNDNILAKLLLGEKINPEEKQTITDSDGNEVEDKATIIDTAGNQMAFYVMLPFFLPNYSISGLSDCINIYKDGRFNSDCELSLSAYANETILDNYKYGIEYESLGLTFRPEIALIDTNDHFIIDYKYPLSTATAVITCLLLITFCIDVGVRSVKLAFLQLIYPIPVISFMDPKSGKDGIFSKWYKMCLTTFLSLFIRLLALYFGIYVISRVGRHGIVDNINGSEITNGWVKLFVIIGILMFVKQLPKLLENLGIKLDGDGKFTLNPLKKVFDENNGMFGAKGIKKAGVAAGAAGLAGAAAFGTNLIARKGNPFSALAGAVSGARRGLTAGLKGDKFRKAYSSSYDGAMNARTNRADRKELGINAFNVAGENLKKKMHIANASQKYESELKHLDDYIGAGKAAKTRAESEIDKKLSNITVSGNNLGALKHKVDVLKGMDANTYAGGADQLALDIANAESDFFKNRKKAVNAYMENSNSLSGLFGDVDLSGAGFTSDAIVSNNVSKMQQLNSDYGMNMNVNTSDLGISIQNAEDRQAEIKGSRKYRQSELISQQAQKEKNNK